MRIGLLSAPLSRANGGVFEAVVAQAAIIRDGGAVPIVCGTGDRFTAEDAARFGDAEVIAVPSAGPAQFGYARGMAERLAEAGLDLLHLHGIWQYPVHAAGVWARRSGRPLIISPHGMLDPWITGRGRAKKALARIAWERRGWRAASAFHALTDDEAQDIQREVADAKTVVIPNAAPAVSSARSAMPPPHMVYLGRIHEKKGLDTLVQAWSEAKSLPAQARLTIAGWGEQAEVERLRQMLVNAPPSIRFVGAVHGAQKDQLLRSARALVLPSRSEGLPMVLLEAWAAGTPTIQTRACHLPEAVRSGAAWIVEPTPSSLQAVLIDVANLTAADWLERSRAAHALALGRFSRETVARQWQAAYETVLEAR